MEHVGLPDLNVMKSATIFEDDGLLKIRVINIFDLTTEYEHEIDLKNHNDLHEIIDQASHLLDGAPSVKIRRLMVDAPVKDGKILKPLYGQSADEIYLDFTMKLGYKNIQLMSTDDAIAMAAWESIGSNLKNDPVRQLHWSQKSRLLSLQSSYDHVGLSLIENGRLLTGLSLPYDDYTASWCSQSRLQNADDTDLDYYQYRINALMHDHMTQWSPDIIVMTIPGYTARQMDQLEQDHTMIVTTPDDNGYTRSDMIAIGSALIERKNTFGWTPKFIHDANHEDPDEDDELLEYEIDA
jgi:hypothetical protein